MPSHARNYELQIQRLAESLASGTFNSQVFTMPITTPRLRNANGTFAPNPSTSQPALPLDATNPADSWRVTALIDQLSNMRNTDVVVQIARHLQRNRTVDLSFFYNLSHTIYRAYNGLTDSEKVNFSTLLKSHLNLAVTPGEVFTFLGHSVFNCPRVGLIFSASERTVIDGQVMSTYYRDRNYVQLASDTSTYALTSSCIYVNNHGYVTRDELVDMIEDGEAGQCPRCDNYFLSEDMEFNEEQDQSCCASCNRAIEYQQSRNLIQCYSTRVDVSPYGRSPLGWLHRYNGEALHGFKGLQQAAYEVLSGSSSRLPGAQSRYNWQGARALPVQHSITAGAPSSARCPQVHVPTTTPALRFAGVELEVEVTRGVTATAKSVKALVEDFAILKSDGSLDDGFEIVSRPMTLDMHMQVWDSFFADKPATMKSFDTSTCGMHVHIGREGMSKSQIARVAHFISDDNNERFLRSIANRNSDRWAARYPKKLKQWHRTVERSSDDRYSALNLQNSGTIEFRIFKGTLKKASFLKNIQFCFALCEFMGDASRPHSDYASAENFVQFVLEPINAKRFPHLALFLSLRWPGGKVYNVSGNRRFSFEMPAPTAPKSEKQKVVPPPIVTSDTWFERDDEYSSNNDDDDDESDDDDDVF